MVRDLPSGAVPEWIAPDKVKHATLSARGDLVDCGRHIGIGDQAVVAPPPSSPTLMSVRWSHSSSDQRPLP